MEKSLKQVMTALITPFEKGEVDYDSLESLLDFQLKLGVKAFVISGTTGESPTLSLSEKERIFKFIKKKVNDDVLLIFGSGTNSTNVSLDVSLQAMNWGADALLVVVPYYNKPPQRGLIEHYKTLSEKVKCPIILYNVPGRTVTSLSLETIKELSFQSNIIAIKEASGDIDFLSQLIQNCSKDFIFLTGEDSSYFSFLEKGGHGAISVMSHLIANKMIGWKKNIEENKKDKNKIEEIFKEFNVYHKLIKQLFVEANPIPVKMALYQMGIIKSPELRLPLCSLEGKNIDNLIEVLKELGLKK